MEDKDLITLTEVVERTKSNTHQIDEIKDDIKEIRNEQKAIYTIATSVELIAKDMTAMKESINEVKQGQKELTEKVEKVDSKSKVDYLDTIKSKLVPWLFGGGCIYGAVEVIKYLIK